MVREGSIWSITIAMVDGHRQAIVCAHQPLCVMDLHAFINVLSEAKVELARCGSIEAMLTATPAAAPSGVGTDNRSDAT